MQLRNHFDEEQIHNAVHRILKDPAYQRRAAGSADDLASLCPRTNVFGVRCNSQWRQDVAHVDVTEDDNVIEASSADRLDQPLRMPILPR